MGAEPDLTYEEVHKLWLEVPEEKRVPKEDKWVGLPEDQVRYRKKMSVLARLRNQQVNPETGIAKFGGVQPGSGRPRKKRVAQTIAEWAQSPEGSKEILKQLQKKLKSDDERVGLRTIDSIVRTEAKEEELQQREQELDDKPRDQIIALLAPALARLQAAGTLDLAELLGGATSRSDLPDALAASIQARSGKEDLEGKIAGDGDGGTDRERAQKAS